MRKYQTKLLAGMIGTGAVIIAAGLPYDRISTTNYIIRSKKIHDEIRICVLADLHCLRFGEKQSRIMENIEKNKPDLIIIPGDLFDVDRDYEISFELIDALKDYPVYFTSGNHDMYLEDEIEQLRKRLNDMGVIVLEDEGTTFTKEDTAIELYGMCDHGRKPVIQGSDLKYMFHTDDYRILISHRPEYTEFYQDAPCDLVLSGHAHGGQWRIPFTHQGLFAPQQGFLPKYTEGVHDMNGTKLIVSRGLASGHPMIPRLYNDPEIVYVTLKQSRNQ